MNDHKQTDNDAENVFYSFDMRRGLYLFSERYVIYGIDYAVAINIGCPTDRSIVWQADNKPSQQGEVFGINLSVVVDVAALIVLGDIVLVVEGNNTIEVAPYRRIPIQQDGLFRNVQSATLLVGERECTLLCNRRCGGKTIKVCHRWKVFHGTIAYGSDAMGQNDRCQGSTAIER